MSGDSEDMDFEVVPKPTDEPAVSEPEVAAPKARKGKLTKDFSLSPDTLFWAFTEDEKNGVIAKDSKGLKVMEDKPAKAEDFEVVEPEAPFVTAAIQVSQMSRTENDAPTFGSSGDPRVDFFFHVMEQTSAPDTISLLSASWRKESLHTLKLVASLRDIQHGKGIRQQYQVSLYWLYQNHPKTLYENLPILLRFGYWKDALHMLMIACFDGFVHPYFASDDGAKKQKGPSRGKVRGGGRSGSAGRSHRGGRGRGRGVDLIPSAGKSKAPPSGTKLQNRKRDDDNRLYNFKIMDHYTRLGEVNGDIQKLRLRFARDKFLGDAKYRLFHTRVAQLFAAQLAADLKEYVKVGKRDVSLAAKWAPSLEKHFDRFTLIGSSIALELARILDKAEILGKPVPIAVYLARKMYNKEVCGPLRKYCQIPELRMSENEWDKVNYGRVPAKCMAKNKEHFIRHDKERLEAYLSKDSSKVAGATLKPIEVIKSVMSIQERTEEVAKTILEKQWISLSEDIKAKGGALLKEAIAVCDVSGSMSGDPMLAAIGLTLLTMNMTPAPWSSICITFHESPSIFNLSPSLSLLEKVTALRGMSWGGSTNLQKVFAEVLGIGLKNKLTPEEMPKALLVFTDMEFDEAFPGTSLTNFQAAQDQFQARGYQLPVIVFWNLRSAPGKTSTPVRVTENGTILLSGWSGQLLAFIMGQKDLRACSPWTFVEGLIGKEKYEELVVYD